MSSLLRTINSYKKYFFITYLITLIAYSMIILASGNNDDFWRYNMGNSWNRDGRLGNTVLYMILSGGPFIVSIGLLPQLFALAVICFTSLTLAYHILGRLNWSIALAALTMTLFPYLIENMAFKFDGIGMALALFFASFPYVLTIGSPKKQLIADILCLSLVILFYQQALNAYIGLAILFFIIGLTRKEISLKANFMHLGYRALPVMSVAFIFFIFDCISRFIFRSILHSNKIISFLGDDRGVPAFTKEHHSLFQVLLNNITEYINLQAQWWHNSFTGFLMALVIILFTFMALTRLYEARKNNPAQLLLSVTLFFGSFFFLLISPHFIMLFTNKLSLIFRYVYSASVIFAVMSFFVLKWSKKYLVKIVLGLLILRFAIFVQMAGFALQQENAYSEELATVLAQDLDNISKEHSFTYIIQPYKRAYSMRTERLASTQPALNGFIGDYRGWPILKRFVGSRGVLSYQAYDLNLNSFTFSPSDAQLVKETGQFSYYRYKIYLQNNTAVIIFDDNTIDMRL